MKVDFIAKYGLSETMATKTDVYSYDILLLEMVNKKQQTSEMYFGDLNLHKWVKWVFSNIVKEVFHLTIFKEVNGDEIGENNVYNYFLHYKLVCFYKEIHTMNDQQWNMW